MLETLKVPLLLTATIEKELLKVLAVPDKTTLPLPAVVQTLALLGAKLKLPDTVNVFPEATVQVDPELPVPANAKTETGLPMVMLTPPKLIAVALPLVTPTDNVPAPVRPTSCDEAVPLTVMAAQVADDPSVSPGPNEDAALVQVAVSAEAGEPFAPPPPAHTPAAAPVRSVPADCLVAVAAQMDGVLTARMQVKTTTCPRLARIFISILSFNN